VESLMLSVLIISPDDSFRKVAKSLNDEQFNIFIAGTFKEGMRSIRKLSIDLIYVDEAFKDFYPGKWLNLIRAEKDLRHGQTGLILLLRSASERNYLFTKNRPYILDVIQYNNLDLGWLKFALLTHQRILNSVRDKALLTHELDLLIESPQQNYNGSNIKLAILSGKSRVASRLRARIETAIAQNKPILLQGEQGCEIPELLDYLSQQKKANCSPQNTRVIDFQLLPPFLHGDIINKGDSNNSSTIFNINSQNLEMLVLRNIHIVDTLILKKIILQLIFFSQLPHKPVLLISSDFSSNIQTILSELKAYLVPVEPLRERLADIKAICQAIIEKKSLNINNLDLNEFKSHDFPGNLFELSQWLKKKTDKDRRYRVKLPVKTSNLPEQDLQQYLFTKEARKSSTIPLKELEKKYIELIIKQNRFNMSESARILGISRKALYDKISRFGIHLPGISKTGT
jgi:DNA-binding protein Fis